MKVGDLVTTYSKPDDRGFLNRIKGRVASIHDDLVVIDVTECFAHHPAAPELGRTLPRARQYVASILEVS